MTARYLRPIDIWPGRGCHGSERRSEMRNSINAGMSHFNPSVIIKYDQLLLKMGVWIKEDRNRMKGSLIATTVIKT